MKPAGACRLTVRPIAWGEARSFVAAHHRHHPPPVGHRFSLGLYDPAGLLRGVAIVGRPVARMLDDGRTAEVTRLATDGVPNGCSALYGAAWREAVRRDFRRLVTYILATEPGTSLIAAGWRCAGPCRGGTWSRRMRPRSDEFPTGPKVRWEAE